MGPVEGEAGEMGCGIVKAGGGGGRGSRGQ